MKVEGMLKGHVKGIFDAGVRYVDTINIKTDIGELCILEVDIQSLVEKLQNRFVLCLPDILHLVASI